MVSVVITILALSAALDLTNRVTWRADARLAAVVGPTDTVVPPRDLVAKRRPGRSSHGEARVASALPAPSARAGRSITRRQVSGGRELNLLAS